jgi:hypothetical protein
MAHSLFGQRHDRLRTPPSITPSSITLDSPPSAPSCHPPEISNRRLGSDSRCHDTFLRFRGVNSCLFRRLHESVEGYLIQNVCPLLTPTESISSDHHHPLLRRFPFETVLSGLIERTGKKTGANTCSSPCTLSYDDSRIAPLRIEGFAVRPHLSKMVSRTISAW